MSRFTFNEPYESEGLEPLEIRADFEELADLSDPLELLQALAGRLSTDTLAGFIDDRMMGRV